MKLAAVDLGGSRGPEQAVRRCQARAALRAGEHRELLTERETLRYEILAGAQLAA